MNKPINPGAVSRVPMSMNGHSRPVTHRPESPEQARRRALKDAYLRLMDAFAKDVGVHVAGVRDVLMRATVVGVLHRIGQVDGASLRALSGCVFSDSQAARVERERCYAMAGESEIHLSPANLRKLSPDDRQAMLAHEAAHVVLMHASQPSDAASLRQQEIQAWMQAGRWGFDCKGLQRL